MNKEQIPICKHRKTNYFILRLVTNKIEIPKNILKRWPSIYKVGLKGVWSSIYRVGSAAAFLLLNLLGTTSVLLNLFHASAACEFAMLLLLFILGSYFLNFGTLFLVLIMLHHCDIASYPLKSLSSSLGDDSLELQYFLIRSYAGGHSRPIY